MEKNAKKIGYLAHQPSGCWWYRIKTPMEALNRHGIPTQIIHLNEDINLDEFQSIQFYGAYPFSLEKVLKHLKEQGIKIVYDSDDALDLIDETNPFYYAVKRDAGSVDQILQYADEITVANERLKDYFSKKTNAKITVIPNCYVPEEWNHNRIPHEEIRIGFAGSATHVDDLIEILPAIKNIQAKYDTKFYIMGLGQDSYETWFMNFRYVAAPKAKESLTKLDSMLKDIKFEWVPFVDYTVYPKVLTELSLDIGICPLKDTPFNRCRTPSKALEYNLSGATVLASDSPTYSSEPTSYLVKDGKWQEAIENAIKLSSNTTELEWIKKNRDINTQIDLLKSFYIV